MADETNSTAPRRDAVPDAPGEMTADRLRDIAGHVMFTWPLAADALRAHADELEKREKAGVDVPVDRPKQTDCRYEPAFPAHETVVFAMSAPDLCIHLASGRCPIEEPHLISNCLEFRWMTDKAFEKWWAEDGRMYDPDTEDVPWFDKRKELAGLAFAKGLEVGTANSQSPSNPKEDVPVEGMLSAGERELTRQHALLGDPLAINKLDASHDACERALREAQAQIEEWQKAFTGVLAGVPITSPGLLLNGILNQHKRVQALGSALDDVLRSCSAANLWGSGMDTAFELIHPREALAQQPPQATAEPKEAK